MGASRGGRAEQLGDASGNAVFVRAAEQLGDPSGDLVRALPLVSLRILLLGMPCVSACVVERPGGPGCGTGEEAAAGCRRVGRRRCLFFFFFKNGRPPAYYGSAWALGLGDPLDS